MLENKLTKTRMGLLALTLATVSGCAGVKANSPIVEYAKGYDRIENAQCYNVERRQEKDKQCVYPVIVVQF